MTFTDGGNPMCAVVPLGAGGTATCSTNALGAGTHTIIASYGGDAGNMVSSGMVAQVINAGGGGGGAGTTTTTLVSSANPAASGASVMFTATVTGATPTGSVNFNGRHGFDLQLRRGQPGRGQRQLADRHLHDHDAGGGHAQHRREVLRRRQQRDVDERNDQRDDHGRPGGAGAEGRVHAVQYAR